MYLNTFETEKLDLLQLPNLFVLYDKITQTITYKRRIFKNESMRKKAKRVRTQ